ncbi:hypothetical protein [Oligoflexus tunisiensis]|uniref:hypothetical protein n=1 Tax=Oligoflexus tunisiensis TaxID=708132 RepID=UPI00114D1627|nr:hypothetical protein [Oligoflexus tunisiensis]
MKLADAAPKILASAKLGGVQGQLSLPAAADVLQGIAFGPNSSSSDLLTIPDASQARAAFDPFGVGGNQSVGSRKPY